MKKKVIMGLVSTVTVALLVACGVTKEEQTDFQENVEVILRDESTALAETVEVPVLEVETVSVEETIAEERVIPEISVVPVEEIWYTEDGTQVLLTATCDEVKVCNEGFEVLAQAMDEWSDLVYNEILAMAEEYASWAAEHYSLMEQAEEFNSYYTSVVVTPERVDEHIVSFNALHTEYTGGVHENYANVGYTFDVENGQLIDLDRLIANDEAFQTAAIERILEVLQSELYVSELFADYEATLRGMFAQDGYVSWYLNSEGIVIMLNPYDVGPYAMGPIHITLAYEEYEQYMALKYRPT